MNCKKCGIMLAPNDKFCLNCGTPVSQEVGVSLEPIVEPVNTTMQSSQVASVATIMESGIGEMPTNGLPVGEPMTQPEPVSQVQPMTQLEPVSQVQPMTQPEPVSQVQPMTQPEPVSQVQPMIQPTPVSQMQPMTQPTPVSQVQPMTQSNTGFQTQPMIAAPKKNNNNLFLIIGGIVLLTVGIVVAMFFLLGKDNSNSTSSENTDGKTEEKPTPTPTVNTYEVTLGNFIFNVPMEYTSSLKSDSVALDNANYYFEILPFEGNNSLIAVSNDDIKSLFTNIGVVVTSVEDMNVDGKVYVVVKGELEGVEIACVLTKSTSMYYLIGIGAKQDGTYSETIVTDLIDILANVEYSKTHNMKPGFNIGKIDPIQ